MMRFVPQRILWEQLIASWRSRSFSPQLYFGVVLSLLGVYGLVSGQVQLLEGEHFIGNLFIFIAVFCWVAYSFLIPPVVKKFGILPTTFCKSVWHFHFIAFFRS
jgi:drug/metabolite transporter (DMT)-like permease